MPTNKPVTRTLTIHTTEDPLDRAARPLWEHDLEIVAVDETSDLLAHDTVEAANTPTRPEPRRSEPDFTWLLLEASIPVTLGEDLWDR